MNWDQVPGCKEALEQGAASLKCLEAVFANVLTVVASLAGLSLFVMLAIGGFRFLTSGGDAKGAESAKHTMTYALLGVALIGLAYVIFTLIGKFTGTGDSLLKFSIPDFPSGTNPTP